MKNLEVEISNLKNTYEDSTELFNKYNNKTNHIILLQIRMLVK